MDEHLTLLGDEPALDDRFGPHTAIAQAIVQVLKNQKGMRLIGILGRWGSGKTTIVRAIERAFKETPGNKIHFFTFDAWQHQHDPARRAFLETLIHFLITVGLAQPKKWGERLKELTGHVERSQTTSTPALTTAGKWMIASLALVPIGISFIGFQTLEKTGDARTASLAWASLGFGALLTLLPAITALILYISWRPWRMFRASKKAFLTVPFWTTHRSPHEKESLLAAFVNKSRDQVSNVTSRDPEPTSIEFQSTFREMVDDAYVDGDELVIVIDNLDRLGEAEALDMWAAVRSLFLGAEETPHLRRPQNNPAVIVPIDRQAVGRLFAERADETFSADQVAQAYMDKTFDITFDVPDPVMSDWRAFMAAQLSAAYGFAVGDREIYWAIRFFEDSLFASGVITPRSVNKYINATVAIRLRTADEQIESTSIFYYCAFASQIREGLLPFLAEERLTSPPADDWQAQVVAIHHGVPVSKAMQVVLADPLRRAIGERNIEDYRTFAALPGSEKVLEQLVDQELNRNEDLPSELLFIANAFDMLRQAPIKDDLASHLVRRNLSLAYRRSQPPAALPADFAERLEIVIGEFDPAQVDDLLASMTDLIGGRLDNAALGSEDLTAAGRCAAVLVKAASARQRPAPTFRLKRAPGEVIRIAAHASLQPNVWHQLRAPTQATTIVQALLEWMDSPADFPLVERALTRVLTKEFKAILSVKEFDWGPLAENAANSARTVTGADLKAPLALDVLGRLRLHSARARELITELANSGVIEGRVNESVGAPDHDEMSSTAFALRIANALDFGPPSGLAWADLIAKQDKIIQPTLAKLRVYVGRVIAPSAWAAFDAAPSARQFIRALINDLVSKDLGYLRVAETVAAIETYLKPLSTEQKRKFVRQLSGYESFDAEAAKLNHTDLFQVATLLRGSGPTTRVIAYELAKARIEATSEEEWGRAIQDGEQPFQLLTNFAAPLKLKLDKSSPIYRALVALAPSVAGSQAEGFIRRWFAVAGLLSNAARGAAYSALAEQLGGKRYAGSALAMLKLGGKELLRSAAWNASDFALNLFVPMTDLKGGRAWLLSYAEELRALIGKGTAGADTVRTELQRMGRSKVSERRDWADKMSEALNLR